MIKTPITKSGISVPGKMALCIKYLLTMMRFRIRNFISHTNTNWAWGPACNSSSWKAKPGNLQSKLVSYPGGSYVRAQGSSERRCLDEEGGQQPRKTAGIKPWASMCIHTCAHASTSVLLPHTHTYIQEKSISNTPMYGYKVEIPGFWFRS